MEIHIERHNNCPMKKIKPNLKKPKPRYFFKQWRKYRGFTQEEAAEMVGVTPPSISQLETGKQGFSDSTLEAFATAYNCNPGDLLMRNPLDPDAPWSIWENIKAEDRPRALNALRVFVTDKKEGTNG